MATKIIKKELSDKLLGMIFSVHNILGPGLLESAYEGAIAVELKHSGIHYERQKVYSVYYKGELVSGYIADIVVDNSIILINYLKISHIPVGYLVNFYNTSVEWRRFVCT
jgi:GxxExxY protein